MNPFQRSALLSLLPIITPAIALAEPTATPTPVPGETNVVNKPVGASWRASEVIGSDVKNSNGESIGRIEDLVVDLKNGEILAAIISTGGFLGLGDTLSAVPSSSLSYDATAKSFLTTLTKEQLTSAPQSKASERADYNEPGLAAKLRAYRDSIGGDVSAPDNSAHNEKDASGKTLTPGDQGNSTADIKTTQDIRMAIVARKDLSFNAKNIKIITREGAVTLRGVVDSHTEHAAILEIAKTYTKTGTLTDELEAKN